MTSGLSGVQAAIHTAIENPIKALYFARKTVHKPKTIQNSSFCWISEGAEFSTTLYLYNYWSENYKIERPTVVFAVYDVHGKLKGEYPATLEPNGTTSFPVATILEKIGVSLPFEGSILGKITSEKLADKRPFQMNVDYFYDNGKKITSVHSQGGLASYPDTEIQTSFHVSSEPHQETYFIVRNCLDGSMLNGKAFAPTIALLNHKGQRLTAKGPKIPPRGLARIRTRELFPQLDSFLEGKPGNAEIEVGAEVLRSLFYIYDTKTHTYTFNHGTEHKTVYSEHFFTLEQMNQMGIGPVGVGWIIEDNQQHTRLIPCVNICEGEDEYGLNLTLFDTSGKVLVHKEGFTIVRRGETPSIEMHDWIKKAGIASPFTGTFRLSMQAREQNKKYPKLFSFITEFYDKHDLAGVQFDSGLHNMPTHNLSNEFQTTKVFSRIHESGTFHTRIGLINSSGEKGCTRESNTLIQLLGGNGAILGEKTIIIPPNGSRWINLEECFPTIHQDLKPWGGIGTIKVRDRTCRVVGFHFVGRKKESTFLAVDHLFGG